MKRTIISVSSLCLALSMATVFAEEGVRAVPTSQKSSTTTPKEVKGNEGYEGMEAGEARKAATTTSSQGDLHRSEVATLVKSLLSLANRSGGIGEQVRKIANEQASSTERTLQVVSVIEGRNALKTFLIGSDYKNLGALRSEIAQTSARLDQLSKDLDKLGNSTDKVNALKEMQVLKDEQAKLDAFVKENESKFSLFGWAVKFFQ